MNILKKTYSKIKVLLYDYKLYLYSLISLLFFGIFSKIEFATDTYCVFAKQASEMISHFLTQGRFVTALVHFVVTSLKLDNTVVYMMSFISSIICLVLSLFILDKIFSKKCNNKIILPIAIILTVLNIFSIELYLFLEKGILILSILCCVIAFYYITKYVDTKKKKFPLLALFFMTIATMCYQGTLALFVALSVLYCLIEFKNFKKLFFEHIVIALCYGIPAVLNYIIVIVFGNNRVSGTYNFVDSLSKIISGLVYLFKSTFKILPSYIFVFFIIALLIIGLYKSYKNKNYMIISSLCYLGIVVVLTSTFPQFLQSTDNVSFAPRNCFTIASIIGIFLLYISCTCEINSILEKIIVVSCVGYLLIQYTNFQNIARDRYIVNYMDYYYSLLIKDKIERYENENDSYINKVVIYTDDSVEYTYPNVFVSGDTNLKATYPVWARVNYLEYYLNRNLEEVNPSENIYTENFKDKFNKLYNDDQIVIDNDTLHIFVY